VKPVNNPLSPIVVRVRTAIRNFKRSTGDDPDRILLSPNAWVEMVNAIHHSATPLDLAREMRADSPTRYYLEHLTFMDIPLKLSEYYTIPEIVACSDGGLNTYAARWHVQCGATDSLESP